VGARHLAEFNVARLKAPIDDPSIRGFVDGFYRISRLAERSPGFVWRLESPTGHVTAIEGDDRTIATLSVWESYEHLHDFVYRSFHGRYTARRTEWFERQTGPTTVLWWIPAGERPSLEQAKARLQLLMLEGPTPRAFSLLHQFDPDGRPVQAGRRESGEPVR
jgi:heme-degrading monooxygenase HmoA